MELLRNWVHQIPKKTAKSRALLGRRKCGKSAIMQRLFNILWNENGVVIPFYFEVRDINRWLLSFADIYYRTFMSQFLSFKTRTVLDNENCPWDFAELIKMAKAINNNNALKNMDVFQNCLDKEQIDQAIDFAFSAPGVLAGKENVFFLVMIDEIQYMTEYLYHDKAQQVKAYNLPGAYHGLVESKVAPMLVSGSYVGWMVKMMREMFVGGRLKQTEISSKLTPEEGFETVYRYADFYEIEVTDESALVINQLTQSDPFYIASLLRSDWIERDFSTKEGVIKTLDYEVRNRKGELFGTWSEYIYSTIKAVNDRYAKQILLFLSRNREKECTRTEISEHLNGKLPESKLEEKLNALEAGDLITQGSSNFRYRGISDDILDLIFRDLYEEEIYHTQPDVAAELTASLEKDKEILSLKGALNDLKGRMLELVISRELNKYRKLGNPIAHFRQRFRPVSNAAHLSQMEKMLTDCSESRFDRIWTNYYLSLPQTTVLEIDVLAEGEDADCCWALVFELKNRDVKNPPSMK
ncbi:ATPase domain protein, prokaryote domain protein, partial [Candidatus Thiomargarita nelsonii]